MDLLGKFQAERAYKKSVQQMMDEKMCRPGYRWHGEPLNRCLPAALPSGYSKPGTPDTPAPPSPPAEEAPMPTPDQAISTEAAARKQTKKGK